MIGVIKVVDLAFQIYFYMVLAYVLMSWVPNLRETAFGQWIEKLVDPYLSMFRKFIPPIGMIDFSPIVAILALSFVQIGLKQILFSISIRFGLL